VGPTETCAKGRKKEKRRGPEGILGKPIRVKIVTRWIGGGWQDDFGEKSERRRSRGRGGQKMKSIQ